jgi:hypothetical protein
MIKIGDIYKSKVGGLVYLVTKIDISWDLPLEVYEITGGRYCHFLRSGKHPKAVYEGFPAGHRNFINGLELDLSVNYKQIGANNIIPIS